SSRGARVVRATRCTHFRDRGGAYSRPASIRTWHARRCVGGGKLDHRRPRSRTRLPGGRCRVSRASPTALRRAPYSRCAPERPRGDIDVTKAVTDTTGEKATNRPRQRPRDRKNRILAAAAQWFWTLGYHQVSMADIAADVDITASALYRHFRGKQDLLLAVLDEQLRAIEEVDPARADDFAAEFIDVCLRQREFGVLWERESGHLPDDERDRLRHRIRVLAERAGADIEDRSTADVRSWAILSVLESQSYYHGPLDLAHVKDVLTRAVSAISTTPLPPDERVLVERADGIRPASRREHLLAVAVKLFAERGYPSVGLDDIGAAAGIAGPSVYNHFTTKVDVLS